jgi:hypothetical protein
MPLCRTRLVAAAAPLLTCALLTACASGAASDPSSSAPAGTRLDGAALQKAIAADLGRQVPDTWDVTCPQDIPLGQGRVTPCTATASDGLSTTIIVTQTDAAGAYTWRTDAAGGANASATPSP